MKFGTRHLLYLTTLTAINFALCALWFSRETPAYASLIPLSLAASVSIYVGWTQRPILLAALAATATAALSATTIATQVILEVKPAMFLYTIANNSDFHANLTLNALAILAISISAAIGGAALAALARFIAASLRDRRMLRVACCCSMCAMLVGGGFAISARYRITNTKRERVRIGMSQREVETILGPPNPLPDLKRKGEAYWDAYTHMWRRYVAIHITYDDQGQVKSVNDLSTWMGMPWLYW